MNQTSGRFNSSFDPVVPERELESCDGWKEEEIPRRCRKRGKQLKLIQRMMSVLSHMFECIKQEILMNFDDKTAAAAAI